MNACAKVLGLVLCIWKYWSDRKKFLIRAILGFKYKFPNKIAKTPRP